MRVVKYIPQSFYGFTEDEHGTQVFFHLSCFENGGFSVPPILGEEVDVVVDLKSSRPDKKAPGAKTVSRIWEPVMMSGIVETFDQDRGFGFISGEDGKSYHLHKSEIIENRIPLIDMEVYFYAGYRKNRPRACHIKIKNKEKNNA
jgi:cold shock CspA family protein